MSPSVDTLGDVLLVAALGPGEFLGFVVRVEIVRQGAVVLLGGLQLVVVVEVHGISFALDRLGPLGLVAHGPGAYSSVVTAAGFLGRVRFVAALSSRSTVSRSARACRTSAIASSFTLVARSISASSDSRWDASECSTPSTVSSYEPIV